MDPSHIIHLWAHDWYGLWRTPAHDYDDVPALVSACDPSWNPQDKEKLIAYLQGCQIIIASTATAPVGYVPSRFLNALITMTESGFGRQASPIMFVVTQSCYLIASWNVSGNEITHFRKKEMFLIFGCEICRGQILMGAGETSAGRRNRQSRAL